MSFVGGQTDNLHPEHCPNSFVSDHTRPGWIVGTSHPRCAGLFADFGELHPRRSSHAELGPTHSVERRLCAWCDCWSPFVFSLLVDTDFNENLLDRRLPITDVTADIIREQQSRVRKQYPNTPSARLVLLPAQQRNPYGEKSIRATTLTNFHHDWIQALPPFTFLDGTVFPKHRIILYAYRHSYAQRHADAGTPVDVLRDLMGHRNFASTQTYYRITEKRTRAAVDTLAAHQLDGAGRRLWHNADGLLDSDRARQRVGEVAVPFGSCTEPSNVRAGGGACPFRFRCTGCGHFRTDVSYLPELRAYLDQLLTNRERVTAATEREEWARVEATPSDAEIDRVRGLIRRVEQDLGDLEPAERTEILNAVNVVRATRRTVHLDVPQISPPSDHR